MKISEIITDKYKLRIEPTVYYDLLADVREAEEKQEPCEDAVSKQGVAKILLKYVHNAEGKAFAEFLIGQINDLPSVNPQKPCKDVISRQAVIELVNGWVEIGEDKFPNGIDYLKMRICKLPSIPPQAEGGKE